MIAKKERDFKISDYYVLFGLIGLCIIIAILNPVFVEPKNLVNILIQITNNGLLAIGLTMVIITGGIDLSVGSVLCLSGILMGLTMKGMGLDNPMVNIVSIMVSLSVGLGAGLFNGFLITKGKLPPFIATLGMLSIARGLALTFSGGKGITTFPRFIQILGGTKMDGVDYLFVPIIIMITIYSLAWWMLRYTKLGRNTYAVGGNKEAAKLSGINVNKTLLLIYGISGLLCGIVAIILVGRLNTAQPTAGQGYELDAIAASVIGGTSMSGGEGKILGTFIGALFIGVLRNGLNILNISSYIQQVVIGVVIIVAVLSDTIRDRSK